MSVGSPLLDVQDLAVSYPGPAGRVTVVDGVSFRLNAGELFGLVGESGSGKSTSAMAILRLLRPPARIDHGRVLLEGVDLLAASPSELRSMRWKRIALVPQGSMNALSPVMRVGAQIADAISAHDPSLPARALDGRVGELLESVRLPAATAGRYPHELSGGMRQRVCIAMAVALGPRLLVADEPTSALDVVVQRAVAEVLLDATMRLGASLVLIGHDLALQAQLVDRIAVMRAGRVVELGTVHQIFRSPVHAYTRALLAAVPSMRSGDPARSRSRVGPEAAGCALGPECDAPTTPTDGRRAMHQVEPGHLVVCGCFDEPSTRGWLP